MSYRPTRAEIDLEALAHNLGVVKEAVGGAAIYAVVKGDAYGHGAIRCAERLVAEGAAGLAVALLEEALALRSGGVPGPIVVLNGIYGDGHAEAARAGLSPVVYRVGDVERFAAIGAPVGLHLKVDTGMHRLGANPDELTPILERIEAAPELRLEGLMTHLSSAGEDRAAVVRQLARFDEIATRVSARGHRPVRHVANSAGALVHPEARYDAVRPGIALYGGRCAERIDAPLRPVMRLVTEVVRVQTLTAGEAVGYGRAWVAPGERRVATLAIGYGDGVFRRLGEGVGSFAIGGARCPIVGRVSMDLISVDVSGLTKGCRVGDEAVLFGGAGPGVDEVADALGTIAYEVLSSIGPRVPRRFG